MEKTASSYTSTRRRSVGEKVHEDFENAKEIHPAVYLVSLVLIVGWSILPRVVWTRTHDAWLSALAFAACVGGFFVWGCAVDRISNWIEARREHEEATGVDDDLLDAITVGQKITRLLAMVILIPLVVVLAIFWYGSLLLTPVGAMVFLSWLVSLASYPLGMAMLVASPFIGLFLGWKCVRWWINKATPQNVAMANAVGIATAGH